MNIRKARKYTSKIKNKETDRCVKIIEKMQKHPYLTRTTWLILEHIKEDIRRIT